MKLTTAQESAVEALKKEYKDLDQFPSTFDSVAGRQISRSTMRSLCDKGVLKLVSVEIYSYTVKGRFGRGIRYTRQDSASIYAWA